MAWPDPQFQPGSSGGQPAQPVGGARVDMNRRADGAREVVLVKREQRYVFTCAPGEETTLLERLRQMARDPQSDIEWFDAALISHQLGAQLSARLDQRLREQADTPHEPPHESKE